MESLQRVNQEQRLAEWGRRVEACRSSGLPVGQWCEEHGIAVSTYFAWQRKVFEALKGIQEVTFAEVPVMKASPFLGHVVASLEVSGVQIRIYEWRQRGLPWKWWNTGWKTIPALSAVPKWWKLARKCGGA